MAFNNKRTWEILTLISGCSILIFVILKAYLSSFTHDESFSYLNYCHETFMQIISYSNWYTNNHILNSLFMKYAALWFGSSELALRLPNIVLLIVYLIYAYLIFKGENRVLALAIFILLSTNHLLNDLFGLARGYGMSCGFMLMSFYYFIQYLTNKKIKNLLLFHFAALLASLSSFTLLTFYASILLVYSMYMYVQYRIEGKKINIIKVNLPHLLPLLFSVGVMFEPVRRVISYSELNFGGKQGFYHDSISSLVINMFHNHSLSLFIKYVIMILMTLMVAVSFALIVRNVLQKHLAFFKDHLGLVISNFLVLIVSFCIIGLHIVVKADYPIGRFSIFLFPIFILHVGFFVSYLFTLKYKRVTRYLVLCVALISMVSFWQKSNLYSCAEWKYDRATKDMLSELNKDYLVNESDGEIILGINWLFEPTINFYKTTKNLSWLKKVNRDGLSENDDFRYLLKKDLKSIKNDDFIVVDEYEEAETILLKRK